MTYITDGGNTGLYGEGETSIQRLCSYIPYFESIDPDIACRCSPPATLVDGSICLPGFTYDAEFMQFVEEFQKSCLVDYTYMQTIEQRTPDFPEVDIHEAIETADLELMKAIMTRFVRAERFCDGAWDGAIRGGIFLAGLRRLRELSLTGQ